MNLIKSLLLLLFLFTGSTLASGSLYSPLDRDALAEVISTRNDPPVYPAPIYPPGWTDVWHWRDATGTDVTMGGCMVSGPARAEPSAAFCSTWHCEDGNIEQGCSVRISDPATGEIFREWKAWCNDEVQLVYCNGWWTWSAP
jgi:hypothetical protein